MLSHLGPLSIIIFSPPAPSAAPADLVFLNSTSSTISIQWKAVPCIHRNGKIISYIVQYQEVGGGVFINESVSGDQRETSITGLQSSTLYDMQIAAVNSVGTGPFTNMSFNASTSGTIRHVVTILKLYIRTSFLESSYVSKLTCKNECRCVRKGG